MATLLYTRVEASGEVASESRRVFGAHQYTLRLAEIHAEGRTPELPLRLLVTDKGSSEISLGQTVYVKGILAPVPASRSAYFERNHTVATVRAERVEIRRPPRRLISASNWIRHRLSEAISQWLPPTESSLMLGLLIGEDSGLPAAVRDAFRKAGMSHLTAVSGQNFAVVLGMAAFAIDSFGGARRKSARLSRHSWPKAAALGGVALFFVIVTRWEPSVMRAAAMTLLALSWRPRRRIHPLEILSLSVASLIIVDPFLLDSAGFQLSVAATAGILVCGLPRARWLKARTLAALGRRSCDPLACRLLSLLPGPAAICLGAQAFVSPVLLWRFGQLQPAGAFSNLVAVPVAELASHFGFAAALPAVASPGVAGKAYAAVRPLLSFLVETAQVFSRIPSLEVTMSERWRGIISAAACLLVVSLFRVRSVFARRFSAASEHRQKDRVLDVQHY